MIINLPAWQDVIIQSVRTLRQERASEVFLDILGQLIAGGQVVLDDDMRNPREYPAGVTVVGYKQRWIYLSATRCYLTRSEQSPTSQIHNDSHWDATQRRWIVDTGQIQPERSEKCAREVSFDFGD